MRDFWNFKEIWEEDENHIAFNVSTIFSMTVTIYKGFVSILDNSKLVDKLISLSSSNNEIYLVSIKDRLTLNPDIKEIKRYQDYFCYFKCVHIMFKSSLKYK